MLNNFESQKEINQLISLYKKDLLKEALIKAKFLSKKYPKIPLIYNIYGMINVNLKKWIKSIDCFSKALELDSDYAEAHNNLGIALYNCGRVEESIKSYSNAIKVNPNYSNAYNSLGSIQNELGRWDEAIKNYTKALELKPNHADAYNNLIKILTFHNPKNVSLNSCVITNKKLKKIKYDYNSNKQITDDDIVTFFKSSKDIIFENTKKVDFNASQIYRRNTIDLNCNRHFKVFNTFNVIPKYCFGCYKVQIEPKTVIELFKLFFVFDNLILPNNNTRKCFIEMRPEISGIYKGLIFCFSLEEANKIQDQLSKVLRKTINEKIIIKVKRGCSEFGNSYPKYTDINQNGDQIMKYKKKWNSKEKIIDEEILKTKGSNKKIVKNTLSGVSLSDILIMFNWLIYAKKIGDISYKIINDNDLTSFYIDKELSEQLSKRIEEFSSFQKLS